MLEGKYNFAATEKKWQDYWQKNDIYKFNEKSDAPIYSIDTPPPTVNGKIHMGHLSSYIHIEDVARHRRMLGENVYFPFGFDDNGLPTERYIEKLYGRKAYTMPRDEFIELCHKTTIELEKEFYELYKSTGFSCNLKKTYSTISQRTQQISQESFLELYKNGKIYHAEAPALWCTECHTAVAQSELDDMDIKSTFNYIKFTISGTDKHIIIATTRPEMLPACVCVFINPNDKKNQYLLKEKITVPIFNFDVPVYADEGVDPQKGSGVVMCCTFGDNADKEWQRKFNLPIKECFNNFGKMTDIAGEFEGLKLVEARKAIIEKIRLSGLLVKQVELEHSVSTHERCGNPIEIVIKKQWFIDILSQKERLYQAGLNLNWYPIQMRSRYLNWVKNLQWNWCISRQRYFGIPFPVWFCKKCHSIIVADKNELPVNPMAVKPSKKCKCGSDEFIPETDVMDTWATSSLTPQLACDLLTNKGLSDDMLPMGLRPNAHDNIRVWDFYTIIKSLYHFDKLPWKDLMISGFVTSSDGSKLAKSKSNNKDTPQEVLKTFSADVTRYWASSLSLGKDTAFSYEAFENGKKLVTKLFNASKFVLSFLQNYTLEKVELLPMDKWIIEKFKELQIKFIKSLNKYEISFGLSELEKFFWSFCDNYIEISKNRLYKPEIYGEESKKSAQYACYIVLRGILKLFSIYIPHITEEIYMSYYAEKDNQKSIHISGYSQFEKSIDSTLIKNGDFIINIVSQIRQFKSQNKVSLKTVIKNLTISIPDISFAKSVEFDIKAVGSIENIKFVYGDENIEFGELVI